MSTSEALIEDDNSAIDQEWRFSLSVWITIRYIYFNFVSNLLTKQYKINSGNTMHFRKLRVSLFPVI